MTVEWLYRLTLGFALAWPFYLALEAWFIPNFAHYLRVGRDREA